MSGLSSASFRLPAFLSFSEETVERLRREFREAEGCRDPEPQGQGQAPLPLEGRTSHTNITHGISSNSRTPVGCILLLPPVHR